MAAAIALAGFAVIPRAHAQDVARADSASHYSLPASFKGNLPITELTENEATLHALDRLAYGPTSADVAEIRSIGLERWIDRQLDFKSIDDSALDAKIAEFKTLRMSSEELIDKYPPPQQVAKREGITPQEYRQEVQQQAQQKRREMRRQGIDPAQIAYQTIPGPARIEMDLDLATVDRAVYSKRQLYEVMCNFWFNHFNVNENKGADRWLITDYMERTIRPHAMSKFEDLLDATAKSPAMLFYLDNWLSVDPVAFQHLQTEMAERRARFDRMFMGMTFPAGRRLQAPLKKQERGLNENYGREVMELHTVGVNAGYTQQDVIEMAKCLTGWTIRAPRRAPEFFFDDRLHDQSPKTVMGHTFHYGGMKDGLEALHMLVTSPATAQHISFELAQHFVSDNPPQALVARMAKAFESSDGDIRAVLKTMIYSPEFWSRSAYRAKIKTPFEVAVSAARALSAQTDVSPQLVQWIARMGEPMFRCEPPTGYADTADVWVNAGALLNRMNFSLALATNHVPGINADLSSLFGADAASDPQRALSQALDALLDGQTSAGTRATLEKQLQDPQVLQARLDDPVKHVSEGLIAGLVLGSPEFQRR